MALVLSDEQQLLQDTVREFVREKMPVKHLRALRDSNDAVGFSRDLWREMAELGWAGIPFPEEYGGSGLGYAELGIVLEECGRTLAPEPFLSTVVLGGEAVLRAGREEQRKEILGAICQGRMILALAAQETPRFDPYMIETRATPSNGRFKLQGEKRFVLDGHVADQLIVAARTAGDARDREGITLFLIPANTPGVTVQRTVMVDSRNAANLSLVDVDVTHEQVLGQLNRGADVLDACYDRGAAALSAQLLGVLEEAFERTIAYLKTRVQFDVPIGSFQALKHRAALMFCEVELSKSIVLDALRAIDEKRDDASKVASAAKARTSDTAGLVTREAIQMHGGIGMTDEEEIGFFLKRGRAAELTLGDGTYHRDRFARLNGY